MSVMKSAYSGPVNGAPKTVYLDHAATTPMLPAAVEAMTAALGAVGNASSLHGSGRAARRSLEEARESIAADLGARPSEVIFTSGGTESDNLAVKGIFWGRRAADPRRTRIVTSSVEHHAVLDAVEWLEKHEGAQVSWLPVDAEGVVSPQVLREVLAAHADEVALVSVMWANNEVGTIEPITELAAVAQEFDIPMHSDAIQAVTQIPVDFAAAWAGRAQRGRAQGRRSARNRCAAAGPQCAVCAAGPRRRTRTRPALGYLRCGRGDRDGRRAARCRR